MKKTIAIIASLDTKGDDVLFLRELIHKFGHEVLIIDVGSRKQNIINSDINVIEIAKEAGHKWSFPISGRRNALIDIIKEGISKLVPRLYLSGQFDAVISIGGLQNTLIAVSAMSKLPIGIPKIMVSTMASGKRPFDIIVGRSDIVPFPSLADFSGGNVVTNTVLKNAVAAIVGMVEKAGKPIEFTEKMLIGITTMGVVNNGSEIVIKRLKEYGYQVVSFHSTGVGGKIMDELVNQGVIKAVVDFSLHEIVSELFGGYSSGANNRLINACEKGIPQIVVPGGCDFIDFEVSATKKEMFNRKHVYHNSNIVHFKLLKNEIIKVGEVISNRLNKAKGSVIVIIPLQGFREGTKVGEPLYEPDVDNAIIHVLKKKLSKKIKIIEVNLHINDDEFGTLVSSEMRNLLKKY